MNIYRLPAAKFNHYLNRYINFITHAIQHPHYTEYNEEHHILPESMGGNNAPNNLVSLSARHHYLAHWMLWKAYKSKEMTSAFFSMSNQNNQYQGRKRRITSRTYERLRKEFSQIISDSTTKLWQDPNYRQKHIDTNNKLETHILRSQKATEMWKDPAYVAKVLKGRKKAKLEGKYIFSAEEKKSDPLEQQEKKTLLNGRM